MRINIDKSLILSNIKKHYNFEKDAHFANFLGVKPTTLSSWHSRNTFDIELLFAKCVDIDANYLLSGIPPMLKVDAQKTEQRPIVEINPEAKSNTLIADVKASAGFGSILDNPKKIEELPAISLPNTPYGLNVAFQITGDSMHPTIRHLDYIASNQLHSFDDIRDGYVYIIIDKDDGALCKRLYHQGNDIQIVSDNPSYPPYSRTRSDLLAVFKAFCRLSFDFRTYHNDLRNDLQDLRKKVNLLNNRVSFLEK